MKRLFLGVCLLVAGTGMLAFAEPVAFRSISSVKVDTYFDSTFSVTAEEVLLMKLHPLYTLEAHVEREDGSDIHETHFYAGPIITWTPQLYTIFRYGIGLGADDGISHELFVEFDHEEGLSFQSLSARYVIFPDTGFQYIVPSVGGRWTVSERDMLLSKYFFSWNTDEETGHSLWMELTHRLNERFQIKGGATAGLRLNDADTGGTVYNFSIITGGGITFSPDTALRYHLEYLGDSKDPHAIRNMVVFDASF